MRESIALAVPSNSGNKVTKLAVALRGAAPNRRLEPHFSPHCARSANSLYTLKPMLARTAAFALLCLFACGKGDEKNAKPAQVAKEDAQPAPKAPPATTANQTHSGGMERYKDPTVYVDGKPTGVLRFGELPVTLKPVWKEEKAAVPFKKGDKGPRFRIVKERRYRFSDYFRELGVDVDKITEVHLYGGNQKAA